jgi:hypothetical protein
MLVHIESIQDGFLVATREGCFFFLNKDGTLISSKCFSHEVETEIDSGLLSFRLDPDFKTNGFFYVYFTVKASSEPCLSHFCNELRRYTFDPEEVISDQKTITIWEMAARPGHHGGGMDFGPNGLLYLGIGDGGVLETINLFAQDPNSHLGKVIAIDVNCTETCQEMVAMGFRNPFTAVASDRGVFIGDVGDEVLEEVNLLQWSTDSVPNFGWPFQSGPGGGFIDPVDYFYHCESSNHFYPNEDPFSHEEKLKTSKFHNGVVHECQDSIVSVLGLVNVTELEGCILFSDSYQGWIRCLDESGQSRHVAHFKGIVSVSQSDEGEIYGVSLFGSNRILKMIPNPDAGQK